VVVCVTDVALLGRGLCAGVTCMGRMVLLLEEIKERIAQKDATCHGIGDRGRFTGAGGSLLHIRKHSGLPLCKGGRDLRIRVLDDGRVGAYFTFVTAVDAGELAPVDVDG
jgi:hypothetical protein